MRIVIFLFAVTLNYFQLSGQDTIRILPLGNSITHAQEGYNSWRRQLFFDLSSIISAPDTFDFIGTMNTAYDGNGGAPFPNSDFDPDHEGRWGIRADEVEANLSSWLTNLDTPDIVLMHLGHNDCFLGETVASTIAELEDIIDTLRLFNPAVTTLVAQVIPSTLSNDCLNELNAAIPAMVSSKNTTSSPVILVDQNTDFDAVADTYDGIHPNVQGENKMAARWFAALQGIIQNILPVDLTYFKADRVDEHIKLSWGTENELGIEAYQIERSTDLKQFAKIGTVPAHNSQQPHQYHFLDPNYPQQDLFYRLVIRESDGQIEYSDIVNIDTWADRIHAYPTISRPGGRINLTATSDQDIRLFDMRGKVCASFHSATDNILIPTLSAGTYFLKSNTQGWVQKIVIE